MTPGTVARQAPLPMGLPRQEHWSGLPFPPPGDLPHPGVELESPVSPALQVDSFTTVLCGKPSMVGLSKDEKRESVSDPVMPCFLWSCGPWLARLLCPRDSPGQNIPQPRSGLPFPSPGDLPHPGIEPEPPASQAGSLPSEPPGKPKYSPSKEVFPGHLAPHPSVTLPAILFHFLHPVYRRRDRSDACSY